VTAYRMVNVHGVTSRFLLRVTEYYGTFPGISTA
jgi:hypothetical protein